MKKILFFAVIILALFITKNLFPQSSWVKSFFSNTSAFSKIVKLDSLNYMAFCSNNKYFYRSSDEGNNWSCSKENCIDTICIIFDGQFINSQTGWISGETTESLKGFISKTTNGGNNWVFINTGFQNWNCRCLYFLNENTGWIGSHIGLTGCLLKTTNGGSNWLKTDFPGTYQINSVKFFDSNNGWIVTEDSAIYRTSNGGANWYRIQINNIQPAYYRHLYPINNNDIYALIIRYNQGYNFSHVYRTTNGGGNWNPVFTHTDSLHTGAGSFYRMNFINASTGFIFGSFNYIYKTTDSGNNWLKIYVNRSVWDLLISNANEIFICGGSGSLYSHVLKSTNSGLNWNMVSNNWAYTFTKTEFIDNNTGFLLADSGKIFKTIDNGENWTTCFSNAVYSFKDISFANSLTGCVIDNKYNSWYGRILRTTNSGNSWMEVYNSPYKPLSKIKFINQFTGYAGCDSNRLLKTTNAGLNWSIIPLNAPVICNFTDLCFINNNIGWVLGNYVLTYPLYTERNIIWKTTDSGNNWSITFDSLSGYRYNFQIYFINENTGFKLSRGLSTTQKTTNSGANWFNYEFPNLPYPETIKFINQYTGWVGGDASGNYCRIIKTTDAGLNWYSQFYEYGNFIQSLEATDSNHAWFCGRYSNFYKTTNGGGVISINGIYLTVPEKYSLSQNYPNPFNPVTNIRYKLPAGCFVKLMVFDITGKKIRELVNRRQNEGVYNIKFDGSDFASGIYFCKLIAGEYIQTMKMILIK